MPISELDLLAETEEALRKKDYQVARGYRFHAYVDARADLYAVKDGEALVVEVEALPRTARVQVSTVQQVDRMAHLSGPGTQGLLVTSGTITEAARAYARRCDPPVLLGTEELQ